MSASPPEHPIVVGYDGSDGARDALALAGVISAATGRPMALVDVFEPDRPGWAEPADGRERKYEELHAALSAAPVGADIARHAVRGRSIAEGLRMHAEGTDASAIVVGCAERAGAGRTSLGTVAQQLLHGSPCAVAVAPRGFAGRKPSDLTRIVVGYVDSDEARSALRAAARLAGSTGAGVRVVAVAAGNGAERAALAADLDDAVRVLVGSVAGEGVLVDGDPATRLLEQADGADLIITGSRGYGPARQVLLGSVTARLLSLAAVPVIVVPRGAESELVSAPGAAASRS